MTVFKVIGRMSVGDNTAIVVDGKGNLFHNCLLYTSDAADD